MQNTHTQKICFHTFGCKLNYAETSQLSRQLKDIGYTITETEDIADIHVINTCSVTEHADKKCKKLISSIINKNAQAYVVVIGCYAQLKSAQIASIEGVKLVLGAKEKFRLPEYLQQYKDVNAETMVHCSEIKETKEFHSAFSKETRTRTFLKIQDGCNYSCSFCTIPLARGASRSDNPDNVIKNIKEIASNSVKEIVLTGVNIGDYTSYDADTKIRFIDLLKQIKDLNLNIRYRISSIEANLITEEIVDFISESGCFVPHFHIPLQSGCNKILKLMRRRYTTQLYKDKIAYIKNKLPNSSIGADVIVGFPNETHEDFIQTYNFINGLDISYLHVFPYSDRSNTVSIKMPYKIDEKEKSARCAKLIELSHLKSGFFYKKQIETNVKVLFENTNKQGYITGLTDNYIRVYAKYDKSLINEIKEVKLLKVEESNKMLASIL